MIYCDPQHERFKRTHTGELQIKSKEKPIVEYLTLKISLILTS